MAARLLLMPPLHLDLLADCLAVGDTRFFEGDLGAELALQAGDDDIKMLVTESGDQLLLGFGVLHEGNDRVLFDQAREALSDLALLALLLGDNCHRQGRHRITDFSQGEHPLGITEGIAGERLAELCHRADVARRNGRNILLLFAGDIEQLAEPLGISGAGVDRGDLTRQLAGDDLHIGKLANERIGDGFEHIGHQRLQNIAADLNLFALGGNADLIGRVLGGRQMVHNGVKQRVNAVKGE